MKYFRGTLKCPHCGSKVNQSYKFDKSDINLEEGTVNISAGCGVLRTIKHYMNMTPNCGKPYNQTKRLTRRFKRQLEKELKEESD